MDKLNLLSKGIEDGDVSKKNICFSKLNHAGSSEVEFFAHNLEFRCQNG